MSIYSVRYKKMMNIFYITACLLGTGITQASEDVDSSTPTGEVEKKSRLERMRDKARQTKKDAMATASQAKSNMEDAAGEMKTAAKETPRRVRRGMEDTAEQVTSAAKAAPGRVKRGVGAAKTSLTDTAIDMLKSMKTKVCTTSVNQQMAMSQELAKRAEQIMSAATTTAKALRDQAYLLEQSATRQEADCRETTNAEANG